MSRLFIDTPYLIFQNHETQNDGSLEAPDTDIKVLRELAKAYAEIASEPVNGQREKMWQRLNDLEGNRPLIWMNEICWNEMNVDDELTLCTENEVCQRMETQLRRTLYQWKHMQGDMIVGGTFHSPYILKNTGFGIETEADVIETEKDREIASRHFHNQLISEDDIQKIKDPVIEVDHGRTRAFFQFYARVFDGILPVEVQGCTGFWFAPWDDIVFWMNADNVLLALADRPDFMHKIIGRLCDAYLSGVRQFESLGMLARNDSNVRVGSGGYGYTRELPGGSGRPDDVKTCNLWGSATPQIFGSVSPEMHREFGIDYERRWLEKFGLAYYGCCEPLHRKIGELTSISNLRKISISPWADVAAAAELMRGRYVMSLKPGPMVLAGTSFDAGDVRKELSTKLKSARGCNVEIILKDISTVRHEPWRLWQWEKTASEVVRSFE
jgi:hypothetical protein